MPFMTALPSLAGARGRISTILFVAAATLAVGLGIGNSVFFGIDLFRNIPADSAYGFQTTTEDRGGSGIGWVLDSVAAKGLKPHDRIVAIDNDPVSITPSENEIGARMERAGRTVSLLVRTGTEPVRRIVLSRTSGSIWTAPDPDNHMPVWLSSVLIFLNDVGIGWLMLAVAVLLFLRRRHDPAAMTFAFAFTLASIGQPFWLIAYGVPAVVQLVALAIVQTGWGLLALAIAAFPDGRIRSPLARIGALLAFVAPVVVCGTILLHPDSGLEQTNNPIQLFANLLAPIGAVMAIVAQVLRYRRAELSTMERQQYKWTIFGLAVAGLMLLPSGLIYAVHPPHTNPAVGFTFFTTNIIGAAAVPLGLAVSLIRYRLYDADAAISRSVALGALTLALLAIFAGSEKVIEILGEEWFGESLGALAGGLGAALAAVMIAPLHHRVTHWAEHRFQRALLHLRQGLPRLVADLRETAMPAALADAVLARCEAGVRASGGAIVLDGALIATRDCDPAAAAQWLAAWVPPGDAPALDCDRADPMFPVRVPLAAEGIGAVGWMLLGPRPDGSFYGKDEREALLEIADPVARALAIAQVRARDADERGSLLDALTKRVGRIETAIAALAGRPLAAAAD